MEIQLKTGENLILEVTPLMLEYIEDCKIGINELSEYAQGKKDNNGCTRKMYATNQLLYAIIASNYNVPLTYRQAVGLVKLEDVNKILEFIIANIPSNSVENKEVTEFQHRI